MNKRNYLSTKPKLQGAVSKDHSLEIKETNKAPKKSPKTKVDLNEDQKPKGMPAQTDAKTPELPKQLKVKPTKSDTTISDFSSKPEGKPVKAEAPKPKSPSKPKEKPEIADTKTPESPSKPKVVSEKPDTKAPESPSKPKGKPEIADTKTPELPSQPKGIPEKPDAKTPDESPNKPKGISEKPDTKTPESPSKPKGKPVKADTKTPDLPSKYQEFPKKPKPKLKTRKEMSAEDSFDLEKLKPNMVSSDFGSEESVDVPPVQPVPRKPESRIVKPDYTIPKPKSIHKRLSYAPKPKSLIEKPKSSYQKPPSVVHRPKSSDYRPKSYILNAEHGPKPTSITPKTDSHINKAAAARRKQELSLLNQQHGFTRQTESFANKTESRRSSRKDLESTSAKGSEYFKERIASGSSGSYAFRSFVKTLCCVLPVRYYELWVIFSIMGYFSIWLVLVLLSIIYLCYGVCLCSCYLTIMFDEYDIMHWAETLDSTFKFDPLYKFNFFEFEPYMKTALDQTCKMLFKHGLLFIFLGICQFATHIHGFFAFYFRYVINLLFYAIGLFAFFIILQIQRSYFVSITDNTMASVFKLKMVDILDQKECHICVVSDNATTASLNKLSDTDFILKFQSCVLNCCGYNEDENSLPFGELFDHVPIVCCKDFHPRMFETDRKFDFPSQLKCFDDEGMPNVSLPSYPFSTKTCRPDQRIPPCEKPLKNNVYYTSTLRFTNFILIFINVLAIYYFIFSGICGFYFVERLYSRRRILKDIHNKLLNYQTETSQRSD